MRLKITVLALIVAGAAFGTRMWSEEEFRSFAREWRPSALARPESLVPGPRRFNYLERIKLMCDFVARYQVSDSLDPEFGGIIEAEHMPNVVETDNTQEAIWVWSRWYELTGRDDYRENIRRAWVYVLRHPAYWEHSGVPLNLWYAVWNCGLALMAEPQYRRAYGDSSFLPYADSCAGFVLRNPLSSTGFRDNFVAAQSCGMAYDYAAARGLGALRDTCVARGVRVKAWIEADAQGRLGRGDWAMSGGTAFWGVCQTFGRDDTAAGRVWVEIYAESLPGFYPTGSWNCSHNIWLANAYRAAAGLDGNPDWRLMHQYLTDTLIQKDTDRDGGIPATWTDPNTQDQTWVSTYLDFMGMDVFVTPTFDHDVSAFEFAEPRAGALYVMGDTIPVRPVVANVGRSEEQNCEVYVSGPDYEHSATIPVLRFLGIDTLELPGFVPLSPGTYRLDAVTAATGDENPLNDSSCTSFKVYGRFVLSGSLFDSVTAEPIRARLRAGIKNSPVLLDSCETDSAGRFALRVLDTLVRLSVEPEFPYFRRSWDFAVRGDTACLLVSPTAHLLLVNNDSLERYESFYTGTFDSLGLTYHVWRRPSEGLPPYPLFSRLRGRTLVWYSGGSRSGTIPPADRDSLAALCAQGHNLLFTGQNIAEELAGTEFLADVCGVEFDSTGWAGFPAYGNRSDSLGRLIHATATAGGDGASNQTSRDIILPLRNGASLLMVYDTITSPGAAVRRLDPVSGARIIFLGFGFEAVNRPQSRPDFLTRRQLMATFFDWFGLGVGVAEPGEKREPDGAVRAWPSVFFRACRIAAPDGAALEVFDAMGRRVAALGTGRAEWRPDARVGSGLYFIRATHHGASRSCRVVYLKPGQRVYRGR